MDLQSPVHQIAASIIQLLFSVCSAKDQCSLKALSSAFMENYRHLRNLDRGSTGQVALYLCLNSSATKSGARPEKVVIKRVDLGSAGSADLQAALEEVRILASLRHPNIVRHRGSFIDDSATTGRVLCLAMDYASGGSLSRLMQRQKSGVGLSESRVASFGCQLLLALDQLHSRGVLHRDLKPDNILLASSACDVCQLADFGVASLRRQRRPTEAATDLAASAVAIDVIDCAGNGLVGTPAYLSPEVFSSDTPATAGGELADVWALGCCLYEMCCLRRAFDAPTLPALVAQIAAGHLPPIDSARYSPLMSDLISQMLTVDPLRRPTARRLLSHPLILCHLFPIFTDLGCVGLKGMQQRKKTGRVGPAATIKNLRCRESGNRSLYYYEPTGADDELLEIPYNLPHEDLRCVRLSRDSRILGLTKRDRLVQWDLISQPASDQHPRWTMSDIHGLESFKVVQLDCGRSFSACLTDTGVLFTFGCGRSGALGHGDFADSERPRAVESLALACVTSIACGADFAACATAAGEVFAWGRLPLSTCPTPKPAALSLPSSHRRALKVFAGPDALLVLAEAPDSSSAALLATGSNRFGRLGYSETTRPTLPNLELLPLEFGHKAELLNGAFVSDTHSLLLLSDGRLKIAGRHGNNEPDDDESVSREGFSQILSDSTVNCVCAGKQWSLVASTLKSEINGETSRQQLEALTWNHRRRVLMSSCRVHSLAVDFAGSRAAILCRRFSRPVLQEQ